MSNGVDVSTDPQPWRVFDWRFLLPNPSLGRVWSAPGCAREAAALRAAGIDVARALDYAVDTALVDSQTFDVRAVEQALSPRTLVRIAVGAGRLGVTGARLRPLRRWRRELEDRGWEVLTCAWAAPRLEWTRAYVEVGNRRAVARALSLVYYPRGVVASLKVRAARAIVRLGGQELVCREGVVLARTPS